MNGKRQGKSIMEKIKKIDDQNVGKRQGVCGGQGNYSGNPGNRNFRRGNQISKITAESDPFIWEGNVHPLLVDHVLKTILVNLPGRDLEQCMKVCEQWKSQAAIVVGKRQALLLRSNPSNSDEVRQHLKDIEKDEEIGIGSLDLVGLRIKRLEFCGYLIHRFGSTLDKLRLSCCSIPSLDLVSILKTAAPSIKVLHLRSVGLTNKTRYGEDSFGNSDPSIKPKGFNYVFAQICMPWVEELVIVENAKEDYLSITQIEVPSHGPLSCCLTLLMTAFPNLKSLYLRCNIRPPLDNVIPKDVRKKCNWLTTLKTMKIEPVKTGNTNLNMKIFHSLAYMTISLTTLTLDPWQYRSPTFDQSIETLELMNTMLLMNAGSLKDLTIKIRSSNFSNPIPVLPMYMPELESLAISANLVGSFDHLKYFPKLKHFEIEEIEVGSNLNSLLTQQCLESHQNVQSLKVVHWGSDQFGNFAKVFPSLRALDATLLFHAFIYVNNDKFTIREIVKDFPDLEYLRMKFSRRPDRFTDPDIMGILPEDFSNGFNLSNVLERKTQPGLMDMKRLKLVDLYPMENVHDIAIKHGFCLLKNIEYLNLSKTQISPAGLEMIGRRLSNLKVLKLQNCPMIRQKDVDNLQTKRKQLKIIFSTEDKEEPFCLRYRTVRKQDHSELLCNCLQSKEVTRSD